MIFAVITFLIFVSSAEIDICVPAFPQIQAHFGLTPFTTEMLLGVNLLLHCIGAFFAGNLGDKYGKKIVINYGLLIFLISSYVCFIADSFSLLLIGRAFQGLGVAMPMVLGPIIVLDVYEKEKQQSMRTMMTGFTTVAICIAPSLGSYLTLYFGWQANFLALFIMSIMAVLLFNIFIPSDKKTNNNITFSIKEYAVIFKSPLTLICVLMFCLECGSYYAFVGMAPIIYIESFGVSLKMFGIYQGILTLTFGIFSIFSKPLINYFGKKTTFIGSMIMFVGFLPMCLFALIFNTHNAAYITFVITILSVGVAIPLNFLYVFALNSIPEASSRISAIMTVGKWLLSIIGFQLASYFYSHDFRSTGWIMLVMEGTSIVLTTYLFIKNKNFKKEMIDSPIPKNMTLPMPGPHFAILGTLLIAFLIHIIFVNFTVGGSALSVIYEICGLKNKKYDHFAHVISKTITANKSLAVVMGVGPLLCINVLYTAYFYTANALTGYAWISIIPLVATTFLFIYLHKYTWHALDKGWKKAIHILIGIIPALTLLFIPLIFLTNINLMLFPDKWVAVKGFFSALMLSNALNRYLHFVVASFALTGLFLVWYFKNSTDNYCLENNIDKQFAMRTGYNLFLYFTLSQFIFGFLVWWTLPEQGSNLHTTFIAFGGAIIALFACLVTVIELRQKAITGMLIVKRHYQVIGF
ncbi:unnamed protein product [Rotaria magnacalcarata]|uniref:Major facilitator superfamily (MFS) profile domain-containing protein n=1 Tax=Rotaria magnacalcarata TaxID=392030 RepID=A0A816FI88_9BILA|nr:unnamed protein product [Rotaria magnacalcarata]CAF3788871.1 unnamed protein product [Rotaria magnacalcarata]